MNSLLSNFLLFSAFFLIGMTQNVLAEENTIVAEITAPEGGSTYIVNTAITLTADASSDAGVERVNFKVDGQQVKSDASEPWSHSWTPTEPGTYVITATVVDNDNKRLTTEGVTITVVEASVIEQLAYTEDNTPHQIPGRIEFEHYDLGGINVAYWDKVNQNASDFRPDEMVDISSDGTKVRDIKTGEWLEYTINIPETAEYELYVNHQVRRTGDLKQLTVSFPDEDITFVEEKVLQYTGSSTFITEKVGTYTMEAGEHVLRFYFFQFGIDVDYFELKKVNTSFQVTFDDGTNTSTQDTNENGTVDLPETPIHAEKIFKHWTTASGDVFDENTIVTEDMTVTAVWETKTFEVNITAENGTVTVSPDQATYDINTEVTLTATAAEGYEFTSWTGGYEGTDNPTTITVVETLDITAHFTMITYDVTFDDGDNTTIKTTKADGTVDLPEVPTRAEEDFKHWLTASGDVFDENTIVTEDMTVTAVWETKQFGITITSANGSVAVSPDQEMYDINTEVTLSATANENFLFTSWSGDYEGTENPATVTVTNDLSITANYVQVFSVTFDDGENTIVKTTAADGTVELPEIPTHAEQIFQYWSTASGAMFDENSVVTEDMTVTAVWEMKTFSITVTSDNGTVTANPQQETYEINTEVVLTATADDQYEFSAWSGDYEGTENPITVTVTKDLNIVATYIPTVEVYQVTFNDGENTVVKTTAVDGTVELPETPLHAEKIFQYWSTASGAMFDENTIVTEDMTVMAVWETKTFAVNIIAENGAVSISPDQELYEINTEITLTATPAEGYAFTSWSGDIEGTENPSTVTVSEAMDITANFTMITYDVTFDDGTMTTVKTTNAGGTVELPEVPVHAEKIFQYWSTASGAMFDENTIVTEDLTVTAVWEAKTFEVNITAENGTVDVSPDQELYEINAEITLTATPAEGFEFTSWSGDLEGMENPAVITVSEALNITANFTMITYDVTFDDGTMTTVKTASAGGTVELPDVPTHIEKIFKHWETLEGAIFDENTIVNSNMSVNAVWEIKTFGIEVEAENGAVTVGPEADIYEINSEVLLTAIPEEGYEFESWSGDYIGTENPVSIIVTDDLQITANFKMKTITSVQTVKVSSKVYPNPTNGMLHVELPTVENAEYRVYSMIGEVIAEGEFVHQTTIDLTSQSPSVYVIEVRTHQGVDTKKIIFE